VLPTNATFAIRLCAPLLLAVLLPPVVALGEAGEESGPVKNQVYWASFLARHDLVWDRPAKSYFEAPFVGNGLVGAMIWQDADNALRLSVGRTDVTDHRDGPEEAIVRKGRLPIGHFLLTTAGKIRGGTMRLALYDAEARGVTVKYPNQRSARTCARPAGGSRNCPGARRGKTGVARRADGNGPHGSERVASPSAQTHTLSHAARVRGNGDG